MGFTAYLATDVFLFIYFFYYVRENASSCLLSSFLLLSTRHVRYLVDSFQKKIISDVGIRRFSRTSPNFYGDNSKGSNILSLSRRRLIALSRNVCPHRVRIRVRVH